jgi:hypothetical protein
VIIKNTNALSSISQTVPEEIKAKARPLNLHEVDKVVGTRIIFESISFSQLVHTGKPCLDKQRQ